MRKLYSKFIIIFSLVLVLNCTYSLDLLASSNGLDDNEQIKTGWIKHDNKWYLYDQDGKIKTGWQLDDGNWYYLESDGVMKTGWLFDNNNWYFLHNDGKMFTGWHLDNGNWYFLHNDGKMFKGWHLDKGNWYFLHNDGKMFKGWHLDNNNWYYLKEDGVMATGWQKIDNLNYYFEKDGKWNENKIKDDLENGYSFEEYNKTCDWSMRIVNPYNPLPKDYIVNTTVYDGLDVDVRMVNQLKAMVEAAEKSGLKLWLSSAYRTNELQTTLFERKVTYYTNRGYSRAQAEQLAKKSVAAPGTSEHQMGLAVDFNGVTEDFSYTPEYAWLSEHAAEYGFIERYAEEKQSITHIIYEPWHYRYVGKENAMKIKESGYCLEEYVYYNLINE